MIENFNEKIAELREKLRRKRKVEFMLEQTREELKVAKEKMYELKKILQKEEKDVKKLETLGITGLFYYILGDKDRQLDKERQEYLAAKLKYDECYNSIKDIEEEVKTYEEELREYLNVEEEYRNLLTRKQDLLLNKNDQNSQRLKKVLDKTTDLKLDIKEIEEAISAGKQVQNALEEVIKALKSAKNWGAWDMFGGGLLSTAIKHSKIDDAKEQIHNVQRLLRIFKKELSDVGTLTDIDLDIGSFETFADYFFDSLIADWIVQTKINKSLDKVNLMKRDISRVLDILEKDLYNLNMELEKLQEEVKVIIEEL